MVINDRLARLEGEQPCEECPYSEPIRMLESVKIVYADGSVDYRRDPRLRDSEPQEELCGRCPYGPGGLEPPIRTIEVVRTVEASRDEY